MSIKEDKNKAKILDKISEESGYRLSIILGFEEDELKIANLDKLNNEENIFQVILSLKEDETKIKYLSKITKEDKKIIIIMSLKQNNLKLDFLNIKHKYIKVKDLRRKILEYSRNIANKEILKYRNLSNIITEYLKEKPIDELIVDYQETINEICNTLEISIEELIQKLKNYVDTNNPEIIINLVRNFICKYKEKTAYLLFEKQMEYITHCSMIPREKIILELKKEKRKQFFSII